MPRKLRFAKVMEELGDLQQVRREFGALDHGRLLVVVANRGQEMALLYGRIRKLHLVVGVLAVACTVFVFLWRFD
jgi:nitrate reductase NapAB chaperone NapD